MLPRLLLVGLAVLALVVVACVTKSRRVPSGARDARQENRIAPRLPACADEAFLDLSSSVVSSGKLGETCGPQLPPESTWLGLALNGPKKVTLPHDQERAAGAEYRAVVACLFRLPAKWSYFAERVFLVFEPVAGGARLENSVAALDQPNGLSVQREPPPMADVPFVTPALWEAHASDSAQAESHFPNFSLLDFPVGTSVYKVHLRLDGVRSSNELEMTVTRLGPGK